MNTCLLSQQQTTPQRTWSHTAKGLTGLCFALLISHSPWVAADTTEYYKGLRYNHVSLHVPIKGVLPIDPQTAKSVPHYVFKYDDKQRLTEIVNNTYNQARLHPLTNFASKTVKFSYPDGKQIRTFYDINDQPMNNIRGVAKEVYLTDDTGFIYQLNFYDLADKPAQSRWNIHRYQWQQKNNWVVEQRFTLEGEKAPLSPYFKFADSAIEYNQKGQPVRHYNLDENGNIANNEKGTAYYQDDYDEQGLHTKYGYYDKDRNLVLNQWQFAYATKQYDQQGYYTGRTKYDLTHQVMPTENPFVSKTPEQDAKIIKQVAENYLVALQTLDPELMEKVMHPDLSKHTVVPFPGPEGKHFLRASSYDKMLDNAKNWNRSGMRFPPKMNNQVTILDQYNHMATVKMVSDNWVEYLHLVKLDGQWQIKNLVWTHKI